jgi:hypothetical protein
MMLCQSLRPPNPAWVFVLVLLALLHLLPKARGFGVTLTWDGNVEVDLAGYKVHVGAQSDQYYTFVDAGLETLKLVQSLDPGCTYHFAVSACSSNGMESELSADVTYTVPIDGINAWIVPLGLTFSNAATIPVISFTAGYGQRHFVQASEDFRTWRTVHTTPYWMPGPTQWADENAASNPKCFYRIVGAWP